MSEPNVVRYERESRLDSRRVLEEKYYAACQLVVLLNTGVMPDGVLTDEQQAIRKGPRLPLQQACAAERMKGDTLHLQFVMRRNLALAAEARLR